MKSKKILARIIAAVAIVGVTGNLTYMQASASTTKDKSLSKSTNLNNKEQSAKEFKDGEVIIKFKGDLKAKSANDILNTVVENLKGISTEVLNIETISDINDIKLLKFKGDKKADVVAQELKLKLNDAIEYVEPNYILKADVQKEDDLNANYKPNEKLYAQYLWGLNNTGQDMFGVVGVKGIDIKAEKAWDLTKGSSTLVVGVIDTGVDYSHPDLARNMYVNTKEVANNGKDDDNNGYIDDVSGWDFYNADNDAMDDNGHGTHCAGTIAAKEDGAGVIGVAPNVKIMPLKFLSGTGSGSTVDAIAAIDYATKMKVKILSNSWGGGSESQALKDSIKNYPGLFLAAAGNDSLDNDLYHHYPSDYDLPNIVSVAAINNQGGLASFSNYGVKSVDIAAPGEDIVSSVPGGYASFSGTSMATPHVSGVAALLLSKDPSASTAVLKDRLLKSAAPLASLKGKVATGGMVDAYKALTLSQSDDNIPGVLIPSYAIKGTLDFNSDKNDVYKAYFKKGDMVSVQLTGPTSTNFDLRMFSPTAKNISETATLVGSSLTKNTSTESISLQIPADGYYYINARTESGSGAYNISIKKYTGFAPGLWQNDSKFLRYSGAWQKTANAYTSGGNYSSINAKGSVEFSFNGTSISLGAYKNSYQGIAKITLDGKVYYADLYSANKEYKKIVFSQTNLAKGNHKVKIEWTGQKSPKSAGKGGTFINLDAISVK